MLLAIFCSRIVLPVRGGATITPRWPKPSGVTRSTTRMLISSLRRLELDPALRMERRQVVEADLLAQLVGILEVDRLDPQQGEVALVLLGRPDLARDDRAGLEAEAADLARGDIDIVGAGEVVVVGASKKPKPSGRTSSVPSPYIRPFCLTRSLRILKIRSCFFSPV